MAETEQQPQLYLISPPELELSQFPDTLARVLDAQAIACVRLALDTRDEDRLSRTADALRAVTDARDVALVVTDNVPLAERLGLDGVHLTIPGSVRDARKVLGPDAIVGAFCGGSRHDGLSAGEAGADYIAFGPVQGKDADDDSAAEAELFQWWSEVIEIPVIAEGNLDRAQIAALAPYTDFFGIGMEIWGQDDPAAALTALLADM